MPGGEIGKARKRSHFWVTMQLQHMAGLFGDGQATKNLSLVQRETLSLSENMEDTN